MRFRNRSARKDSGSISPGSRRPECQASDQCRAGKRRVSRFRALRKSLLESSAPWCAERTEKIEARFAEIAIGWWPPTPANDDEVGALDCDVPF